MRFDYTGKSQAMGRVTHSKCGLSMLGEGENDPRIPNTDIFTFCDCPEDKEITDTDRLEWMIENTAAVTSGANGYYVQKLCKYQDEPEYAARECKTPRQAIDTAMKEEKK